MAHIERPLSWFVDSAELVRQGGMPHFDCEYGESYNTVDYPDLPDDPTIVKAQLSWPKMGEEEQTAFGAEEEDNDTRETTEDEEDSEEDLEYEGSDRHLYCPPPQETYCTKYKKQINIDKKLKQKLLRNIKKWCYNQKFNFSYIRRSI